MVKSKNDYVEETMKNGVNIIKKIVGKSSDNIKNAKENQYIKKLEKRAEIEQYTLAKLHQTQAIKYKSILDTIDHNFDILENTDCTLHEKAIARGKIKALRTVRNEIEKPFSQKSKFSRKTNNNNSNNNNNNSNRRRIEKEDNQKSNDILGEIGKLFEPYDDKHRR